MRYIPGHHEISWPYLTLDIECPKCSSEMEVAPEQWTRCSNLQCQVELWVDLNGLWREKPRNQTP